MSPTLYFVKLLCFNVLVILSFYKKVILVCFASTKFSFQVLRRRCSLEHERGCCRAQLRFLQPGSLVELVLSKQAQMVRDSLALSTTELVVNKQEQLVNHS